MKKISTKKQYITNILTAIAIIIIMIALCFTAVVALLSIHKGADAVPVWSLSDNSYENFIRGTDMTRAEDTLLTEFVAAECATEPLLCKISVAAVIFNRMDSPLYPDTCVDVIFQNGAFCAVDEGTLAIHKTEKELNAASLAVSIAKTGRDPTGGSLCFVHTNRDCTEEKPKNLTLSAGNMIFGNP